MTFNKINIFAVKCITVLVMFGLTGSVDAQHDIHPQNTPLTEPGNDIFGTIQEVVQKLEANSDTDWSQVNVEGLRQHLLDMKAFTEEVEILSKNQIDKGVEISIRPKSERAVQALKNLFSIHSDMVKKEMGWDMNAKQNGDNWMITCTSNSESEVQKIRALGYIGLLAEGAHHQRHHWMIATGQM